VRMWGTQGGGGRGCVSCIGGKKVGAVLIFGGVTGIFKMNM